LAAVAEASIRNPIRGEARENGGKQTLIRKRKSLNCYILTKGTRGKVEKSRLGGAREGGRRGISRKGFHYLLGRGGALGPPDRKRDEKNKRERTSQKKANSVSEGG